MIGDAIRLRRTFRQIKRGEKFGYIFGQCGEAACVLAADQMTIILDRGAAARGVDDHGIESLELCAERRDVGCCKCAALFGTSHMQRQCATAADAGRDDNFAAVALQDPDGGRVDIPIERLLGTAGQECHPLALCANRREDGGTYDLAPGILTMCESDQIAEPPW